MMNAKKVKRMTAVVVALFVGLGSVALAQAPEGGRGERGPRGERGERFNPEQMRARMDAFMREQLGASEEEWAVLGPLVNEVGEKRRETMGGMGRMMGRRGGPDGQEGPDAEANPEAAALHKALADENTPAADIQAKLEAFRKARTVKETELKEAREKLRAAVTARQEARLVLMGILD
ncbi:MAG: hypothetical protein RBU25_14385 [Lentisphaeria bacterium]|jgi:hypothetical protein|nr:hypothetical protein [Lentisphaeria bacterium]